MQNIMKNCNIARCQGKGISQPALRRCWKADAPSWASGLLAWSSSPQHLGGPTSTHCPSVCAFPCTWESPERVGEQRGMALKGTALYRLLWLFLQPAPQASSQPKSQTVRPRLPLRLPPRKEGLPTLKALCVGLASRPLVGTGRLNNHRWHLDQVQGTLVVFQGLSQI